MISIRKNVFETNSSSVHSICISKKKPDNVPDSIVLNFGQYGWEFDEVDAATYFWTAVLVTKYCTIEWDNDNREYKYHYNDMAHIENHIKDVLSNYGVNSVEFVYPEKGEKYYWDGPSIDHGYETSGFVEACLNDDDLLARTILSSDSVVYTGNDNTGGHDSLCYSAMERIYDDSWQTIPNPNNHPEEYDYFMKGN